MKPENMNVQQLADELSSAVTNLAPYHSRMYDMVQFYESSAFYKRKSGDQIDKSSLADNYLQIFADKNIHYTSALPTFKVDGTPEDRDNANIREKIIYAVHRKSGSQRLQKQYAHDATIKSMAVNELQVDYSERCVRLVRHDPREVYWKRSNGKDRSINVFWAVFAITKDEAKEKYGVVPTRDTVSSSIQVKMDPYFHSMDGQTWFTMAIRWDAEYRVAWIGDEIVEEPHEHGLGVIPVDVCAPFISDNKNYMGAFYLDRLINLQAELNDTVRRRSNLVKRLSNPIIWGRGIQTRTYDDVKAALKNAESGVLGLGKDGEVGILQLQELKLLYEHEESLKNDMQRLSGFASASFGESVGANTSGDALGMYFTPTQKHIDNQNVDWVDFWESINTKILRGYDVLGKAGDKFSLDGYSPNSTLATVNDSIKKYVGKGNYKIQFDSSVIAGNYINRAIPQPVTPKNEIEEKRLVKEAVDSNFLSRNTGYEMWGLQSPEDEKAMLQSEMLEPSLNPKNVGDVMGNAAIPPVPGAGSATAALPAPPSLAPTEV